MKLEKWSLFQRKIGMVFLVCFGVLWLLASCADNPEKHYQNGVEFVKGKEFDKALLELKQANKLAPKSAKIMSLLGQVQLQLSQFDEGTRNLEDAFDIENQSVPVASFLQVPEWYFNKGNYTKAETRLEDVLKLDSKNARAYVLRAWITMEKADAAKQKDDETGANSLYEKVLADAQKSIELDPKAAEPYVVLGQLYFNQQKLDEAKKSFEHALSLDAKNIQSLLALASMAYRAQKLDEAKEFYTKALAVDAKNIQAHLGIGEIYLAENTPEKAIESANAVLAALPKGQTTRTREEISARFILGRAYILLATKQEVENPTAAKETYTKAKTELEIVTNGTQGVIGANYSLGLVSLKLQDYQKAIEQFGIVLAANPQHLSSLLNLALAYFQAKQYDLAVANGDKAVALDPNNASIHNLLSSAYFQLGNTEKANEHLKELERLNPDAPVLRVSKAMVCLNSRDYECAKKEAEAAIKGGQNTAMLYNILGRAYAGLAMSEKNDATKKEYLATAKEKLQKALELDNTFVSAHLGLGNLYLTTGEYDLAETEAKTVLDQQKKEVAEARLLLGLVAMARKQYDAAKVEFERAISADKTIVDAHYQLGLANKALNKPEDAIKALEQAIMVAPQHVPSLFNLTLWTYEAGQYDESLAYGNQCLQADPNNVVICNLLTALYLQRGEFDQAMSMVQKTQKLAPETPNLNLSFALVYLGKKEYDKVIEFGEKAIQTSPDNPVAYDTIARAYIAKKALDEKGGDAAAVAADLNNAEENFKKALEKKADHVPSILGLGDLYGIQKRYFESMGQYHQALALKPDSPEAHTGLGGVYRMTGRNEQALQEFEAVLKVQPKSRIALFNAADILLQLGKYDQTIEFMNTLLLDDSQNTNARYLLSQAYAEKGEFPRAVAELETLVGQKADFQPAVLDLGLGYLAEQDFGNADKQFKALLSLNEKHTAGMIGAAIVAQKAETYTDAVSACERALTVQPDNLMANFVLGNIYVSQGEYDKAKDAFKKSGSFYEDLPFDAASIAKYYGENPKSAAVDINLATSFIARGWYNEAVALYTNSEFPRSAREGALVRYSLARAYTMQMQYDKAVQELEAILAAQPDLAVVYKNIGNIYQSKQDGQKAVEAYKKFMDTKPDDAATRVQLGLAYESGGMTTEAVAEYEKILQAMPDSALTMNQLAWLYAERGENLDKALEFAMKASQSRPSAGIMDTLGWVYVKRQEYDQAIQEFQRALELSPLQATIRYHLGVAYGKRGDKALAVQELKAALSIEPNFKEAEDAKKLIDELSK